MQKRKLGQGDHESTVVTLGGAGFGRDDLSQDVVDQTVELALRHGVNHLDIAPSYGKAMERMKPWMPKIRDRIFLGAKTTKRPKAEAWEDIRSCQERLGADTLDLFQLHAVNVAAGSGRRHGRGRCTGGPDRDARAGPDPVHRHHRARA